MSEKRQIPDQIGRVADAVNKNWVDKFAPIFSRPYLRLSRIDRPAGTWLLLIPCLWSLSLAILSKGDFNRNDVWAAVLMAVGAFLMRGAGCTWNDITDQKIDAKVTRTKSRPIPSGQISSKRAFFWMLFQLLAAASVLFTFNSLAITLGLVALIPVAIYPFAKRFTWWPQMFLCIAFNWGALMGWVIHTGSLALSPILLYLAGITWTLFYDTIYAHQDKEDDAVIGVKSTARLFHKDTKKWLCCFLISSVLFMLTALFSAINHNNNIISIVISVLGILGFGTHLLWQLVKLDINNAENCLRMFRLNREAGLLPITGFTCAIILQFIVLTNLNQ